ncbi:hypothetical protein GW846_03025 [Candidatus Gracilibacteria bacterium]|nr:hypothetical protein [Candidatus Gracilibacteria bacterium]
MAKNKTKTQVQDGVKKPVSMILKQDHTYFGRELTDKEKEIVYLAFRRRSEIKTKHAYFDHGEEPTLLRLYLLGSKFNSTVEFLVKYGSFEPLMGKSKGTEDIEVGFNVELKSTLIKGTILLEVLRRQFKATLIIPS